MAGHGLSDQLVRRRVRVGAGNVATAGRWGYGDEDALDRLVRRSNPRRARPPRAEPPDADVGREADRDRRGPGRLVVARREVLARNPARRLAPRPRALQPQG